MGNFVVSTIAYTFTGHLLARFCVPACAAAIVGFCYYGALVKLAL